MYTLKVEVMTSKLWILRYGDSKSDSYMLNAINGQGGIHGTSMLRGSVFRVSIRCFGKVF